MLDSVTKHFYDLGWRGLNVEPGRHAFHALVTERPRDVNVNVATGRGRGKRSFYEADRNSGVSSFAMEHLLAWGFSESEVNVREIEVVPLPDLLDEHLPNQQIDFLKVDVEGAEDEVIESVDWRRHRPRILIFESFYIQREDILSEAGYRKTLWDGINTFWVREEDADEFAPLLAYPASIVLDSYDPWHYIRQIHAAAHSGSDSATARGSDVASVSGRVRRFLRRLPT